MGCTKRDRAMRGGYGEAKAFVVERPLAGISENM